MNQEEINRQASLAAIEDNEQAGENYRVMAEIDEEEITAFCGIRMSDYAVGSETYKNNLAKLAGAMGKVGQVATFMTFSPSTDRDVIIAGEKIRIAQKLLLGAEAILRSVMTNQPNGGSSKGN
jgi:hypothetical protein